MLDTSSVIKKDCKDSYSLYVHRLYGTICSCRLAQRSCMSFYLRAQLKHTEEKWDPILNEAEVYFKVVKLHSAFKYPATLALHMQKHTCIFPRSARMSLFRPPYFRCQSIWSIGKRPLCSLNVVSPPPHISVKLPTGEWWWITYQPVLRLFPKPVWLTATLSSHRLSCCTNRGEHCSGNITPDLSAPFCSRLLGSSFAGNAQGIDKACVLV